MPTMRKWMTSVLRKAALGVAMAAGLGCATTQGPPGYSIESETGSKTGNPFEIRLYASGPELKGVLVNRSTGKQMLLHDVHLQVSTLEMISATGSNHKPYDSRKLTKYDTTPYCSLFTTLPSGTKLVLGTSRFRKSRDGFAGQWGPFHFEELPAGEYQAQVTWLSERTQCLDEATRQMRKLPTLWRGVVYSNQVTLRLR
jgi:hypothetical protein